MRGEDDTPDRYGRQPAFAFLASSDTPVQAQLVAQGEALVSADVANRDCAAVLTQRRRNGPPGDGVWADPRP